MNKSACSLAAGVALLLLSTGLFSTASAGWDDGTWPLEFDGKSRPTTLESDRELDALCGFLKDSADVQAVQILLLDGDLLVVDVVTTRDTEVFLLSSRDLLLLLAMLEDAGLELVASTQTEALFLRLALILM